MSYIEIILHARTENPTLEEALNTTKTPLPAQRLKTLLSALCLTASLAACCPTAIAGETPVSSKSSPSTATESQTCCQVLELRQYTLHPGKRNTLIDLFEGEFIQPQEAVGIKVMGQFRDLDNPDRFVWVRGFADMPKRAEGLSAFYGGPVWKANRDAANATMIDSDNVLLLRPASPHSGFPLGTNVPGNGKIDTFVSAGIYYLNKNDADFPALFEKSIAPLLRAAGANIVGTFVTEPATNNFPKLPVRTADNVLVWFAQFENIAAFDRYRAALEAMPAWKQLSPQLRAHILREEVLRLGPTPRSRLPLTANDGRHDFDFIIGRWHMANKYLKGRLKGSTEWESFDALSEGRFLLDGLGNTDEFRPIGWRPGLVGHTIRIFNPDTRLWTIYWVDNRSVGVDKDGLMAPPVVGKFTNGVGIFECDDTLDGKPIRVRYKWYDITTDSAKWAQSMSGDGGKTWEVNFTNTLTRLKD